MKKFILIGMFMILLAKVVCGQEQLSLKQQADKFFERYEYFKSLKFYLKLADRGKPDVKLAERIATCYRYINHYPEAEEWYAKAITDPKAEKLSHYFYAGVLLRNQKFDQAKQQYKLYFTDDDQVLAQKIADCDSAMMWMKQPSQYKVRNAGNVNTPYSDWGAAYDGKAGIIFTSDRETGDGKTDNRTGNGWFKLYAYDLNTKETKQFSLDGGNSTEFEDAYHVGPMVLNQTSDTAYITLTTEVTAKKLPIDKRIDKNGQRLYTRRLQLVMAVKKNERWIISGSFPYNNVQLYSVGNAALSRDGKLIYFSSDMLGGMGKTDLWYCEKLTDGLWGKPVNCGQTINTKEEESFPNVDENGILYYASKGLPGMGGYEIYAAHGEKANWGTPQNLKYPINTTSDDFNFITRDGQNGYLSSNRDNGQGSDDIYTFTLTKDTTPIKRVAESPKPVFTATNPDFSVRTIYYDLDKSSIRPDAAAELDKLAAILKQHPVLKIVLSSYCDSRASYQYNLALSQRRAKAAMDYLVARGISVLRIKTKGYSETHLVNKCAEHIQCAETDHQLNRRTEVKVISEAN